VYYSLLQYITACYIVVKDIMMDSCILECIIMYFMKSILKKRKMICIFENKMLLQLKAEMQSDLLE